MPASPASGPRAITTGTHIGFSRNAKTSVPSSFTDIGTVSRFSPAVARKERIVEGPIDAGGRIVTKDIIEYGHMFNFTAHVEDVSPLLFESLFQTAASLAAGSTFTPQAGVTLKGWVQIKEYDEQDLEIWNVKMYGRIAINSITTGGEGLGFDVEFAQIYAVGQTGTLTANCPS
jgi:hypothetical protein